MIPKILRYISLLYICAVTFFGIRAMIEQGSHRLPLVICGLLIGICIVAVVFAFTAKETKTHLEENDMRESGGDIFYNNVIEKKPKAKKKTTILQFVP